MEALSVTANIIAVLQAANTIIDICCDYSAAIRGASWELPKVTKELQSLRDELELLKGLAKRAENADPSADARLPALIRMCNSGAGPLAMCSDELESLKTKLKPPKWTGPVTSKRTALMQTITWPLKEGETKKMLQDIERHKSALSMALEIDQTAVGLETNEIARVIQAKTSKMSEDFAELKLSVSMAKLDGKLGKWLSAPDPSSDHNEACAKRQATTGDWFIQSSNFAKWKEDKNSLIWLHGIPGCGKTILCSTVIENVLLETHPAVNKAVAYFYFDFRNTVCQHKGMIRSLVSQLAVRCTKQSNPLESLYSSCGDGARQPKLRELKQTLQDLIQSFDDTFVILDALDELKQREDLLDDIQEIIKWQRGSLHILVTSRREWDIKQTLDPLLNENQSIDIQSEMVDKDIRIYVREILQTAKGLSRWRNKPEVQDEIEKVLTKNAHGMFRWVVCQIDELKKCLNLPMLRKQLISLPVTLPQTYERILLNIEESYSQYVLKMLQWLTYSGDTLSLSQLAEVVAIDEDEDLRFDPERRFPEPEDILLMCASLVTATEEYEDDWYDHGRYRIHLESSVRVVRVKLAHFSVQEYLVSSQIMDGKARKYSIQEIDANVRIAKDCLSYILHFTEDIPKPASYEKAEFRSNFPLAEYAVQEWQEHARVDGQIHEEWMVDLIMELFTSDGNAFSSWCLGKFHEYDKSETPLYYASEFDLLEVATRLTTMGVDVNACSGRYGNALCVASSEGHTEIVKLLLEKGADPNSLNHGWRHGSEMSALHAAASEGHASIVTMLISSGMDVNLHGEKPLDKKYTALGLASYYGHDEVVKILIEAGADPDSKNAALHIASYHGEDEMVKLLLGLGANINQGWRAASPLREAVKDGYPTTVQILLDAGADVSLGGSWNRESFNGWTYHEKNQEMLEVLKMLVDAGAEINSMEEIVEKLKEMEELDMKETERLRRQRGKRSRSIYNY